MVDVVQVMATLAAMVVVIGGGAGAVVWIRRWIAGVATAAQKAAEAADVAARETTAQLRTSNGHTVGQYVEETHQALADLRSEIGILTGWVGDNRTMAQQAKADSAAALALAQRAHDRVDTLLARLAGGERLNSAQGGGGGV